MQLLECSCVVAHVAAGCVSMAGVGLIKTFPNGFVYAVDTQAAQLSDCLFSSLQAEIEISCSKAFFFKQCEKIKVFITYATNHAGGVCVLWVGARACTQR